MSNQHPWTQATDNMDEACAGYIKHTREIHRITGRHLIIYHSGWLDRPDALDVSINDLDMRDLMAVVYGLENREIGVDVILHTPGGEIAATEAIGHYLQKMFDNNIRVIVPHLAMSCGTMLACAAKSIVMGKHSSLGPIDPQYGDPQYGSVSAHTIVAEFTRAFEEIRKEPTKLAVWEPIISQYRPGLVIECEHSIAWGREITAEWLVKGMFVNMPQKEAECRAKKIIDTLSDPSETKSHGRHMSADDCRDIGLEVEMLEDNQELQDNILSLYRICCDMFRHIPVCKIVGNQKMFATRRIHPPS